jgi:hypothetical protein
MTPARLTAAIAGSLLLWATPGGGAGATLAAGLSAATGSSLVTSAGVGPMSEVVEYHYTMAARVRPLVVFWITRSGVGDAVVTRRRAPGETGYSLLIGSDPERAPRRINRWGYIDEEIRGAEARLIGLMTQSDEASIDEAEASVRKQSHGNRTFKVIQATVDGEQARSVVTSIAAPENYSFRQVRTVLELAQREGSEGTPRVVRLPAGTRPGFLSALAELMDRAPGRGGQAGRAQAGGGREVVKFVYHGSIYELRETHAQLMPTMRAGGTAYQRVVAANFQIRSTSDGELTEFSMTYGTVGALAGVPLTASFQPRWWMEIDLAIDSGTSLGPSELGLASRETGLGNRP